MLNMLLLHSTDSKQYTLRQYNVLYHQLLPITMPIYFDFPFRSLESKLYLEIFNQGIARITYWKTTMDIHVQERKQYFILFCKT